MCVSYLHTPSLKMSRMKYQFFYFFTFHFKALKIKAVELWTNCFLKPEFACLTSVKGHCRNVGFYSYEVKWVTLYNTVPQ